MPPSGSLFSPANLKATGAGREASYLLFLTHHLLSSTKQAQLRTWCKDLSFLGLAKRGYPGVILFAASEIEDKGREKSIAQSVDTCPLSSSSPSAVLRLQEVGRRIKRLQWASQDLRPIRPLPSSAFVSLHKVLRHKSGLSEIAKGDELGKMPPMLFLDSMKDVGALFRDADNLGPRQEGPASRGKSRSGSDNSAPIDAQEDQWKDIWKREMKPR